MDRSENRQIQTQIDRDRCTGTVIRESAALTQNASRHTKTVKHPHKQTKTQMERDPHTAPATYETYTYAQTKANTQKDRKRRTH